MKEIDKLNYRPFTRFCMSIGAVPTSYLAGLTIEEQLLWLCSYLEKEVIPAVNNNGEAVEELQNLYVELKNYVDTYFDNLDVQEEINNKLDDMAEKGELADIISQYLNSTAIFGFDNVASMKSATNLVNGSYAKTLGYYSKNDGGEATYKIRTVTNDDVIDEMFLIEIGDTANQLVAELIYDNNEIHAKTLGIENDGLTDVSSKLNSAMQKLNQYWLDKNDINTLVLEGTYLIENKVTIPPCVKLRNSGFVEIKSSVVNDSTFLIDYLSNELPENRFNKQQYLSGSIIDFDKGSKIVATGDKTTDNSVAIEIGSRTDRGVDYPISRYNIRNLTITNFTIGILHNSYNVYIGSYDNISLELNTTNIQFGLTSQISTTSNAGERMTFNNCIIGPSSVGVLFDGIGWETFYDNCSFDFCQTVFKQTTRDQNYWNKINVTNSHFEAFTKLGVNFGVNEEIFNIANSDIYNSLNTQNFFDNCTNNKYFRDTLLHEKYDANELNPETYVSLDTNVKLHNTLSPRTASMNKYFIKNNMLKTYDEMPDGDVNIATNQTLGQFKILEKWNIASVGQIVTDNYLYTGHKSLLLTKSTAPENNGILNMESELLPLTNQEKLIVSILFYNLHGSQQSRAVLKFYDKDGNLVTSKTSYEWFPSQPQANTWSMNPYGFFENVPPTATQYQVFVAIPNFGANDPIGTQYKIGGIIVNSR